MSPERERLEAMEKALRQKYPNDALERETAVVLDALRVLFSEREALREQNDRYFAYFKDHPERWAELAGLVLPATESAQAEGERDG